MNIIKRLLTVLIFALLPFAAGADLKLREDTASQSLLIGPFVDATDGNTPETGLTIDAADVRISINGGNIVGKNSGGCTHDELGMYACTFDATDTATVGRMQITVAEAGALIVNHRFQILEEAVFDRDYAAAATGIVGTAQTGDSFARIGAAGAGLTAVSSVSVDELTAAALADLFNTDSGTTYASAVAGSVVAEIADNAGGASFSAEDLGIIAAGTAQAATGTTLRLAAGETFADDEIIGATVLITSGTTGVGQSRTITDYASSTDTATVATWTTTPTGTITYNVFGTASASGGGGATAAEVWAHGDRQLTALDEDTTTIDLNATALGSVVSVATVGSIATGGITSGSFAAGAINAAAIADNAIDAATLAADVATEVQAGIATASALATVDANVDTLIIGVNVEQMNGNDVCGTGDAGTPWTGCP